MDTIQFNQDLDAVVKANKAPKPLTPASEEGPLAVDAFKNLQVLGHLRSGDVTRTMTAMTTWVSPKQGCAYCHAPQRDEAGKIMTDEDGYVIADPEKLDSDELYTKRVARRMLQMVMHINSDWKQHVAVNGTGVTCFTCHRGNPVPANIWFDTVAFDTSANSNRVMGEKAGQNAPATMVGLTALPNDPFRPFLAGDEQVRIQSTEPLPGENRSSIKQAEWTYGLMMHISQSLGVNCTHCHNSRSMGVWSASPLARTQAWYGIRMVRDLNKNYLEPLAPLFPPERLGPGGDGPKLNCATCHNGAYRPLLGQNMLKDYPVFAEAKPQPEKTKVEPAPEPPARPGAGKPAKAPKG
jgi:photosynthetic reaction center cytochrome c subunit